MRGWLVVVLTILIAGCQVYEVPVVQGNYLRKDLIERLKVGQTKEEVRQLLGNPILYNFNNADQWIYIYNGIDNAQESEEITYRTIVNFQKGVVSRIHVES